MLLLDMSLVLNLLFTIVHLLPTATLSQLARAVGLLRCFGGGVFETRNSMSASLFVYIIRTPAPASESWNVNIAFDGRQSLRLPLSGPELQALYNHLQLPSSSHGCSSPPL
ncbi:hypothetical protein BDQ12DRAFT_378577 [Crucibulum laeve]|uniref:Uncharacterized protein n=1 Tax=Crucibulum laeve TaxID=68775 RepID=A0A5C3LLW8_9AGAR|nr:hypothetical protein BDQ12DRAFT_378577 [Crucibulum laeve]